MSCVDLSSGTSPKLSAASRVDSNTSLLVWLNLYRVGLVCVCSYEVVHLCQWVSDRCPSRHLLENWMSCLLKFSDMNAMSKVSVLPVLLSRCVCSSLFK